MARVSYRVLVAGKVQGVYFRASMKEKALVYSVKGWVMNRDDGVVEALVQGEEEQVAKVVDWARSGPPGAKVDSVSVEKIVDCPVHDDFRIVA